MLFPDRCVRRRRERDQIPADQQSVLFRTLGGLNEFAQKRTKTAKKKMLTGHGTTKHADLDDVKTLDTSDPEPQSSMILLSWAHGQPCTNIQHVFSIESWKKSGPTTESAR